MSEKVLWPTKKAVLFVLLGLSIAYMENAYLSPPDSASYFSVARSLVVDRDVSFMNEYEAFRFQPNMFYLAKTDRLSNDWPIGSGLLWLPFEGVAHGVATVLKTLGWPSAFGEADGFSPIYRVAVICGIVFYGVCGLLAGYGAAVRWFGATAAFWSTVLLLLGTPLGFYFYYYALMAHVTSFFLVTLFCVVWMTRVGRTRTMAEWGILGVFGGLMVMTRPQNAVVGLVLPVEAYLVISGLGRGERPAALKRMAAGFLVFAATSFLSFLPQMVFWWRLYGNPVQMPKIEEMNWMRPRVDLMLFSTYHGLLSWSPLLLLTVPGLWLLHRRDRIVGSAFALVLLIQVYINATNEVWWAGGSFGNRRFVDYSFMFLMAFAACWRRWGRSPLFVTLVLLAAGWNFVLIGAERAQVLTLEHHVEWDAAFVKAILRLLGHPLTFFRSLQGDFAGAPVVLRIVLTAFTLLCAAGVSRLFSASSRDGDEAGANDAPRGIGKRDRRQWLSLAGLLVLVLAANVLVGAAAARTNPVDPTSLETLKFVKALASLEYGETISRTNRLLWNNYYEAGFYYLSEGDLAKALRFYEKARDLLPSHPSAYRYIGAIRLRWGDYETARQALEKAVQIRPDYLIARQLLIDAYRAILSREPRNRQAIKRLSRLYAESRRFDRAIDLIGYAVKEFPDDEEAKAIRAAIEKAAAREKSEGRETNAPTQERAVKP